MASNPPTVGSSLVFNDTNPSDHASGSGQGADFPFAWRAPSISSSQTVVKGPQSQPVVIAQPSEDAAETKKRLFPSGTDVADVTGVRIGHFTIQRRIGVGGMGAVFLAADESLRRNIALKILAPSLSIDPSSVQRFQNEARAAARLDHDNIARVFYYGEDSGLHYIAFEFVPGTNLRDVIRQKGKLNPAEAVNYTMQLAAALSHTAAAGVIHRDIKPSNILITPQGRAKLVDLGLARRENHDASAELTVAGTTLGTFDYISPEQAKDPRNVDVRSDIYSLGCTLYHMLTGEPPYPEGTVLQKLLDHQGKDAPDPAKKNRRVPPTLSAIVRRMMASDPRRRPSNPGELLRELLFVARSLGQGAVPIDGQVWLTATRHRPPAWQRNIAWIATAVTLILIAVVIDRFPSFLQDASVAKNTGLAWSKSTVEGTSPTISDRQFNNANSDVNSAASKEESPEKSQSVATTARTNEPLNGVKAGPPATVETNSESENGSTILPIPLEPTVFDDPKLSLLSSSPNTSSSKNDSASRPKSTTNATASERESTAANTANNQPSSLNGEREPKISVSGESSRPETSRSTDGTRMPEVAKASEPVRSSDAGRSSEAARIVSALDGRTYGNLEAACAEAKDGSIIELRYNGKLDVAERPIRLAGKKNIIIRGGIGFRPQVSFAPTESPSDPSQSRMITVSGGTLEIVNVDIELTIPERTSSDRWVLFSLERPEKLQLHGVTLTLSNAHSQPSALIEQVAAVGQGLGKMGMMKNGMPSEPPKVAITESIIRGETDLILLRDAVPARYQIKDSLVGINGILFHSNCRAEVGRNESDQISLEIDHSTCVVGEGLIVTDGDDALAGRTPPLLVMANNNIIVCGSNRPLVTMNDASSLMETDRQFFWTGDRNYYDSQQVFWQLGGRQAASTRQLSFEEWRNYWGSNEGAGSTNSPIVWRSKPMERAWTKMLGDAVELNSMASSNPAVNGASDLKDAGAPLSRLPQPNDLVTPADEMTSETDADLNSDSTGDDSK